MAATTDSFRSSLHGFNRMDVVQFIQKKTSEHELELRRLAEERTRQQEELEQQKKELAARQEESERQKQELSQLRAELAELREQNAALRQAQEPAGQPAAAVQKPRYDEMELTAYRRAEQTERMARERAAASAVRMRSAFEQAEEKLKARRLTYSLRDLLFQKELQQPNRAAAFSIRSAMGTPNGQRDSQERQPMQAEAVCSSAS